ncbi:MAG: transposase [Ardenticatenia bacterium]|nr:MAG: transposase [Ardenticatenia bacterium]
MPPYDPNRHHRRSIRLKGYDYTQPGAYFVTICTHERAHLFGRVVDGEMVLNAWGEIVRDEWFRTADIRANVELYADEFVVMPNHVHGIIWIVETDETDVGATRQVAPTNRRVAPTDRPRGPVSGSLGAIIGQYKSAVTRRINIQRNTPGGRVWQRNYYEHIIRTERALHAIRRYIADNPRRWHLDRHNPAATAADPRARAVWRLLQAGDQPDDTEATP